MLTRYLGGRERDRKQKEGGEEGKVDGGREEVKGARKGSEKLKRERREARTEIVTLCNHAHYILRCQEEGANNWLLSTRPG